MRRLLLVGGTLVAYLFDRLGDEIQANTTTDGGQSVGRIAVLAGGGFVVVWMDSSGTAPDSDFAVKAQLFDTSGAPVGSEFIVNTTTSGLQFGHSVAALAGGGFAITWTDLSGVGGDTDSSVKGQLYSAAGAPVGGEFLVNTATTNAQQSSTIAGLSGGGFVVAWSDASLLGGDASAGSVKAQLFDGAGAKVGGEILANTTTAGLQYAPQSAALAGGGFALAWQSTTGGPKVQQFDAAGAKVGAEQAFV